MPSNSTPEYNRAWSAKNAERKRATNLAWRENNRERYEANAVKSKRLYKIRHRDKANIHMKVTRAVKKGKIVKSPCCQLCLGGGVRIEGHHPDYSKPLEVIWLCHACHRGVHSKLVLKLNEAALSAKESVK